MVAVQARIRLRNPEDGKFNSGEGLVLARILILLRDVRRLDGSGPPVVYPIDVNTVVAWSLYEIGVMLSRASASTSELVKELSGGQDSQVCLIKAEGAVRRIELASRFFDDIFERFTPGNSDVEHTLKLDDMAKSCSTNLGICRVGQNALTSIQELMGSLEALPEGIDVLPQIIQDFRECAPLLEDLWDMYEESDQKLDSGKLDDVQSPTNSASDFSPMHTEEGHIRPFEPAPGPEPAFLQVIPGLQVTAPPMGDLCPEPQRPSHAVQYLDPEDSTDLIA